MFGIWNICSISLNYFSHYKLMWIPRAIISVFSIIETTPAHIFFSFINTRCTMSRTCGFCPRVFVSRPLGQVIYTYTFGYRVDRSRPRGAFGPRRRRCEVHAPDAIPRVETVINYARFAYCRGGHCCLFNRCAARIRNEDIRKRCNERSVRGVECIRYKTEGTTVRAT